MVRLIAILCCAVIVCVVPPLGWAKTYRPTAVLELHIKPGDVRELREVLQAFAAAEGLIFRDVGSDMPPLNGKTLLYFTLHRGKALQVIVDESPSDGRISVAFYNLGSDPQSKETALKLQTVLSQRWRFTMIPPEVAAVAGSDPDVLLELRVEREELNELRNLIEAFAQTEGFALTDESSWMPKEILNRGVVALTLTRDSGMHAFISDLQGTGHFRVAFYDSHSDPKFEEIVSTFKRTFREKWLVREIEWQ